MTRRSDTRVVVDVVWEDGMWKVRAGFDPIRDGWLTKVRATNHAVFLAEGLADAGRKAQVRVFTKTGRISREMTYRSDPEESRG